MEVEMESRRGKRAVDSRERQERVGHEERFVDVRQAAALLHLSDASIRRYLTIGKLTRFKVGTGAGARTLLDREQVLSLIIEG